MPMAIEHKLMVYQSLLQETERDAALVAAELILELAHMPAVRDTLAREIDRQAEAHTGPRRKIMQGVASRLREVAEHDRKTGSHRPAATDS